MKKISETLILTLVLLMALNPLPTFALAGVAGGIERMSPIIRDMASYSPEPKATVTGIDSGSPDTGAFPSLTTTTTPAIFSGVISGKVLNDATNIGIGGVTVVLRNTGAGTCQSVSTDASGDYSFSVADGNYEVIEAANESVPTPSGCTTLTGADPSGYASVTGNIKAITISGANATYDFRDHAATPFNCSSSQAYLAQLIPGGVFPDEKLYSLNIATGAQTPITAGVLGGINGIAYGKDNYIYGVDQGGTGIYRISANGTAYKLGDLPLTNSNNIGTIDGNGYYWTGKARAGQLIKIDINPDSPTFKTVIASYLGLPLGFDIAWNPIDGYIYSVDEFAGLIRIDTFTGASSFVGNLSIASAQYGAQYFDITGNMYAYNNTGGIYGINVNTLVATFISTSAASGLNDGASCPYSFLIPGLVSLSAVKSQPTPALSVGVTSAYTITTTNSGTTAATTATISEAIPTGLDFIGASGTGWTCAPASKVSPVGTITCSFSGTIAANGGTSNLTINVKPIAAAAGTSVTNKLSVAGGGTTPPTPSTCTGLNTPSVGCGAPVTSPIAAGMVSLSAVKSQPSPALAVGVTSSYTITTSNSGAVTATTATISEAIPTGLDFVSAAGTGWTCAPASKVSPVGTITCTFSGSIAASGGTSALTINVKPIAGTAGTSVTNNLSVDPGGGTTPIDPTTCTALNTPSAGCGAPVTSPIVAGINLSAVKSQPAPSLAVGVTSAYTITATNSGTGDATTAIISEAIPAGLDLVSTSGTGWTCVPSSGSSPVGTVTCSFTGTIAAAGGTSILTINVKPIAGTGGTSVTNFLSITPGGGPTPPPDPTTCTGTNLPMAGCAPPVGPSPIDSNPPVVTLVKNCISPFDCQTAPQSPGTDLIWNVAFTGNGGSPSTTLIVEDNVPTYTEFRIGSVVVNAGTTGLTFVIEYSNDGGATWTYTPVSGAGGTVANYDRIVNKVRVVFTGNLANVPPNNTGAVQFTSRIK